MKTAELTRQALELPADERRALAEALWESLEGENAVLPLLDWQLDLLDQRRAEAERDPSVWVEWPEVESDLRASLGRRRG